jgi:hypothetical protein
VDVGEFHTLYQRIRSELARVVVGHEEVAVSYTHLTLPTTPYV